MVLAHHNTWGRGRVRYGGSYYPWGGYYHDQAPPPRETDPTRYPVYPNRKEHMLVGGAVVLGVVAIVALAYGMRKQY